MRRPRPSPGWDLGGMGPGFCHGVDPAEKDADPNRSLMGFDDEIKPMLERELSRDSLVLSSRYSLLPGNLSESQPCPSGLGSSD
ncbi:hypothetical protein SAY87_023716 [Trapa incisa]|uniref:Uncharacterized protein n=1 Tax=Trapa incisa TaxID=236973 RepID=A0AAN7KZA8_9MYRT|nr:hypothetical protein SAY87_023716 [Trapa incisa]